MWVRVCVSFHTPASISWTPAGNLRIQLYCELSTQRWHQIPQAKGSVLQDHPPLQTPITSPGCYLYFRPTGYKSEVSMTLSLGLTNLLEQLTEIRKPVYSIDDRFIMKDIKEYESTARWRDTESKEPSKGPHGAWGLAPWHMETFWFTHLKVSELHPFGVLWRLHYIGIIDSFIGYWWLSQSPAPLLSLKVRRMGLKVPTP